MKKVNFIKNILLILVVVIASGMISGCNAGKRVGINQARLSNNKDDVKVAGIHKIITISDRDYYVIYAEFKNNTDKTVENVRFDFEIADDVDEIIENGTFEINKIEPGKTVQSEYFVNITEITTIDNVGTITFTDFQHEGTKGSVKCSKEISFDFDSIRIEEMDVK